jgi:hypothetical protein
LVSGVSVPKAVGLGCSATGKPGGGVGGFGDGDVEPGPPPPVVHPGATLVASAPPSPVVDDGALPRKSATWVAHVGTARDDDQGPSTEGC